MITSTFEKTRPLNYILIAISNLFLFITKIIFADINKNIWHFLGNQLLIFGVAISSIYLINTISLKNNIVKNNNFAPLLFLLFLFFFPKITDNLNLLVANFFLLIALSKLLSLKATFAIKQTVFDASFWIFLATLFYFWSILFLLLVFISIFQHASKDYKNWMVPFVALFAVAMLFLIANTFLENSLFLALKSNSYYSLHFSYFENVYQNIAFSVFVTISLLFFTSQMFDLPNKPLNSQSSYKKILFAFVLGAIVYIFSANKNNSFLIFCLTPVSIIGANFIERLEKYWQKEVFFVVLLLFGLFFFFAPIF